MAVRGHEPVEFNNLKGLWQRGDPENVPLDHLADCNNITFKGNNIVTRPGVGISQDVVAPLENIKKIYNYPTQTANTLIILIDNAGTGEIYHFVNPTTIYGPLLSIIGMTDFSFVPYAGRGYITPFSSFTTGDINIQKGLSGQFLYVYAGDGTAARKAAGALPAGTLTVANGAAGHTDPGVHVFGVVGETNSGFLSSPTALKSFATSTALSVTFTNIPTFSGTQWTKRHIVASIVIPTVISGNLESYQLFFIPLATINDNVTTTLSNVSFYDADLLEDASHLYDNYTEIPAGCKLSLYHDRLCLSTTFNDISLILVSHPGEPEAISQIDGLIIAPLDGNPITNHGELRDVFYVFKRTRTVAYIDNGDVPSSWPLSSVDSSLGTCVHGIATVLDSGNSNVDYFIVTTFAGIQVFNGRYFSPELSYKIQQLWEDLDRNEFRKIQIINAPIQKLIILILPTGGLLVGNYANGLDPMKIRWVKWSFLMSVNTIAIWNIDTIIFGSEITTELM